MNSHRITIAGTGCALADFLYTNVSFNSTAFQKYLSKQSGDGGLCPGKLVFTEELERFSGKTYPALLKEITGKSKADSFNIGGPGLVSLIHAAQMLGTENYKVKFYGFTGSDYNATKILEFAGKTPLDLSNYIAGSNKLTPFTDVFSDPAYDNGNGERTFVNNIGAAGDYSLQTLPDNFFDSQIVCFGGTALVPQIHDHLTELFIKARQHNCIAIVNTVYDFRNEKKGPAYNWPLVSGEESFKLIDLLIMDKEEALKISGRESIEKAAEYFISRGVNSFAITNGAENISAFSNGEFFTETHLTALPVSKKVAGNKDLKGDTTGCGDNFAGGMIASLAWQLKSKKRGQFDFFQALSWAIASGGFARFYVGGTYLEKHAGEKQRKVEEIRKEYLKQI